ncbi:MAG: helix-turn-helix domain-containing protein [Nonomuraea sp.]|nr:helix-turn-helix domain-containing protein [Nonomuraea sp.]NUP66771.1 helix-turn-helix domain-containing protein [Nonomuraea sp.]NUP78345.1 helix-turn-helix domain-containing protein [Nonomuraea sp.]NUS09730.1 helix-turn-helix domain-containing protein [Nonomuraea sp.]NUT11367.1 helix-turn-helix domain-containing protein [Nonomuraea sp.]
MKEQVRELRAQGKSPKEIARALKVPPSVVAPLVRAIAAEGAGSGEPEVVGCWTNVGWSAGLGVDPSRGWTDEAPESGAGGMVCVLVARRHTWDKMTVCGYLADVYCLGVKNTIGPDVLDERELRRFREYFFGEYQGYQEVPIELARHLVFGAADYARTLGFEPHEDFAPVAGLLGEWEGDSAITFGRDGRPFYVQGPHDDPGKVLRILRRTLTDDQFDSFIEDPSPAS